MKNSVNVCTCLTLGGYVAGVTIGGVLPLVLLGSGLLISISEMNKIIRKWFVNKRKNTRKLKYESLLEDNKSKNERLINFLYEKIELMEKNEELEKKLLSFQDKFKSMNEKIETLEEKNAELLHENEELRTKKRVKK